MKQTGHPDSKRFLVVMLVGGSLLLSEMPLWASPQQSSSQPTSQSSTSAQKQDDSLPDAPQSQSAPSQTAQTQTGQAQSAPAPAGAAVAPVRQRGHRSLLIKLGVFAGAGIAVGAAVALSERSPSRPPGASPAIH